MLFTTSFSVLLYVLLVYQIILILLYIYNWRWLFISWSVNLKYFGLFILFLSIGLIGYFITRNYSDPNGINWFLDGSENFEKYLSKFNNFKHIQYTYVFVFGNNFIEKSFNFIYVIYVLFCYIFSVPLDQCMMFYTYINVLMYCVIFAMLAIHILDSNWYNLDFKSVLSISAFVLIISNVSFWFDGYIWIVLMSTILILLHISKENEVPSAIAVYVINFSVLTGVLFSYNFIVCAAVINIIQLFISFKSRKENATNYNVLMMFSTLLFIAMIFENKNYLSFILIVSLLVLYSIYMMYHSSNIAKKLNHKIDEFMYSKINIIIIGFVVAIVTISIILFVAKKNSSLFIDPWLINSDSFKQLPKVSDTIANVFYWIANIGMFIYVLLSNDFIKVKKSKSQYFPEADFAILVFLVFWNPLATNLFSSIYDLDFIYITPNFIVIFFCILIPIQYHLCNRIAKIKKIGVNQYIYYSTALITTIISMVTINLGNV